jgi:hypothetical protein
MFLCDIWSGHLQKQWLDVSKFRTSKHTLNDLSKQMGVKKDDTEKKL